MTIKQDLLTRDQEYELARAARAGDRRARERLVVSYRPLAHKMAALARSNVELEDRKQIALIALDRTIDRFDPERGLRLSTLASFRIARDLNEAAERASSRLGLARTKSRRSAHQNAVRACRWLGFDPEQPLTQDQARQVAQAVRASVADVRETLETGDGAFCGIAHGHGDETEPGALLVDEDTPEDLLIRADERERRQRLIQDAVEELDPMERELAERVLLADKPEPASRVSQRHGWTGTAAEATQRAQQALEANIRRFAVARGLMGKPQATYGVDPDGSVRRNDTDDGRALSAVR